MDFRGLLVSLALFTAGTANASTVLTAIDGNVNFLFSPLPSGVTLFMFDDDDNDNFGAAPSLEVDIPSIVGISGPQSGNWLASNANGTLTLTGAPSFVMAVWDSNLNGGTWVGDTDPVFYGNGNAAQLTFDTSGGVYVVDVVAAIPIPAAIWLFATGLAGLAAVARRRS